MNQHTGIIFTLLKRSTLTIILAILFTPAKAQEANKFQPDSIYQNRKVKRIYVYENSSIDLSRIIDLDTNGHKVKIVFYDASYDRRTRARKGISSITRYVYDSEKKLIEMIDSACYAKSSDETDQTYFFYDANGVLKSSSYYRRKYLSYQTYYIANPLKSVTIRRNDSVITSHETEEYDRDFYKKRSYGYYWESKLKMGYFVHGNDTTTYQHKDDKDLEKLDDSDETTNRFNSKAQLISSDINQRFMVNANEWRTFHATLVYKYYANGLLKSISGYVPEYLKYEFYK